MLLRATTVPGNNMYRGSMRDVRTQMLYRMEMVPEPREAKNKALAMIFENDFYIFLFIGIFYLLGPE